MGICITADHADIDGKVSEFFGRCHYFLFIDPETGDVEARPNAFARWGNAGARAADAVIKQKPSAVIAGRTGKNALRDLRKAGIEVLKAGDVTAREALELYKSGKLEKA